MKHLSPPWLHLGIEKISRTNADMQAVHGRSTRVTRGEHSVRAFLSIGSLARATAPSPWLDSVEAVSWAS